MSNESQLRVRETGGKKDILGASHRKETGKTEKATHLETSQWPRMTEEEIEYACIFYSNKKFEDNNNV